ncbi:hypothetical protein C8R46DRAFT_422479 [Mycena filopes]|nr:hypothetical protein C8R46DRAFT_422479 [Mycena filopes]
MLPPCLSRYRRLILLVYLSSGSVDSAAIVRQIGLQQAHSTQPPESVLGSIEQRDGLGIAAGIVSDVLGAGGNLGADPTTRGSTRPPTPNPSPSALTSAFVSSTPSPSPAPSSFSSLQGITSTTGSSTQSAGSFISSVAWIGPSILPGAQHVHKQTIRIAVSISVVGGVILAIGLVFLVLWRRRRRTSRTNSGICRGAKPQSLPIPFELAATDVDSEARSNPVNKPTIPQASDAMSTRQVYISNQVNRAREKVAELEAETSTLLRQLSRSSHQGPPETGDISQTGDSNSPANDQRLERAMRRIEELNGRICDLERQRRSSWALGLSDAPPPEYIE